MSVKRIQLFEFEDFDWFPAWLRSSMTRVLAVLHRLLNTHEVVSHLLRRIHQRHPFQQIVDIGSGAGGIMPEVVTSFNHGQDEPVSLLLTDLHPNTELIASMKQAPQPHVRYSESPLDATELSKAPEGLKTMLNSFHHMPPDKATQILTSAYKHKQPFLLYEMGDNKMPLLAWWLSLPLHLLVLMLTCLLFTPFVRGLTLKQVLFTYLIPIIPVFYAWDGVASTPRIYTPEDLQEILDKEGLHSDEYEWEIGEATRPDGKALGLYLLGLPKTS